MRKTESFTIDTEVTLAHLDDLLKFINEYYLLPNKERFASIKKLTADNEHLLCFTAFESEEKWYINVEIKAVKPIQVKMSPSENVPETAIDQLKEDLIIVVQLFEEKVRKTTLYFAWLEGEEIIPEKIPSKRGSALERILTDSMLFFFIIFIAASILVFYFLGSYAPIVIVAFQFVTVLFSDKIIKKLGNWSVTPKNPNVHLLQYHLPVEEYKEFQQKYGKDLVIEMKKEIYEKTLAVGKELSCQTAEEVFSKYGIKCIPANISTKTINVYELVRKVAERFNLPVPKIVISNTMLPNAAASGPSPSHGTILITTGLLVQLEEYEIFNVLGHEFSHLKGRDPFNLFVLTASEYLLRLYVFWPIVVFFPLLYLFVAMGIVFFIAKFFEARADLESAVKIEQPQVLAEALRKIGFRKLQFERSPTYRIQSWITWDPHPPIYFRIGRLEKLKTPTKIKHLLFQSAKDCISGFRAALLG
ncbi:MAG: M56 family metallopeptidase [Euryarchaeota archaeon]|nr:M56 family metallopeptidase [Euryarchaeota archaeon]